MIENNNQHASCEKFRFWMARVGLYEPNTNKHNSTVKKTVVK